MAVGFPNKWDCRMSVAAQRVPTSKNSICQMNHSNTIVNPAKNVLGLLVLLRHYFIQNYFSVPGLHIFFLASVDAGNEGDIWQGCIKELHECLGFTSVIQVL